MPSLPPPEGFPTLAGVPDVLTAAEAAAACRLTLATIRFAIRRGELPATVVGGRDPRRAGRGLGYRITKVDLERWYFGAAGAAGQSGAIDR